MKPDRLTSTAIRVAASCAVTVVLGAAGGAIESSNQAAKAPIAQLWVEPGVGRRDLTLGAGQLGPRPTAGATYTVLERDTAGFSITYDVKDAAGHEWNVKIGPEAQTEVVASRIVWGLGYHQAPSHFVERWKAIEDGRAQLRGGARFRPRGTILDDTGPWAWRDNPFIGTQPFRGLLVLMMLLNSTDLKDDNNEVYDLTGAREGASRWYVVKDIGASLGETGRMEPRRGYIDGFEREPFIVGVEDGRVEFGFRGRHQDLLEAITVDDVRWMCERVLKLTDRQWRDAFAAGGYTPEITARYVARIKQKAEEGLALR